MVSGDVLWVSTALDTRGGVASYVRALESTPLTRNWSVRHIATHRDGSIVARITAFATGASRFVLALLRHRPRLVHVHTASYGSFARKAVIAAIAFLAGVPVVMHVHGAEFHLFHDRSPRPVRWVIRSTLARCAAVVALGETWAVRLRRISPEAAVTVVPNAVTPPAVWNGSGGEHGGTGGHGRVQVVFLGRIGSRKGAFVLLEAWAKAVGEGPAPFRLTLAGDGEVDRARRRVSELGLGQTVTVRPWLAPDEVAEMLADAHVLALPSRAEGQPMAVLEAMANGLCVIGSDVGGVPEMLAGGCGLVVPPDDPAALADALRRVLDDPVVRAATASRARERVRTTYDSAVVCRRLDELYRELTTR